MILMPANGTIALRDEARRSPTWVGEGQFAVVPRMHAHETQAVRRVSSHLALYLTEYSLVRFASSSDFRRRMDRPALFATTPFMRTLLRLCCADETSGAPKESLNHLANALLAAMLARIEKDEPLSAASGYEHGSVVIAEMCSAINSRLEEDVPLDEIADAFGLSRRHATRLFRRHTGVSIGEYRNNQRVEAARRLLLESKLSVGEIAWRTGFESGSALARAMRRTLGLSPGMLRRAPSAGLLTAGLQSEAQ